MMSPSTLVALWRSQAAQYERDGLTAHARLLERVAEELDAIAGGETVRLNEAARRSGYSTDHLRRMIHAGRLVNVGRKHAPQLRVADLPTKGERFRSHAPSGMFSAQSGDGTR